LEDAVLVPAEALLLATGLAPLAAMLLATFAAFWLHDEQRERRGTAQRPR
jgi:hypothetical protein